MDRALISRDKEQEELLIMPSSAEDFVRIRRISHRMSESEYVPQFNGGRKIQYFAALAANMGALGLGTVLSWSATALPDLRTDNSIGNITESQESWIGSIITLGAVAAGPLAGFSIESFGRRSSMLVLTVPFFIGWLLIFLAQNVNMIYMGRFLTGFCAGTFAVSAPIFTAEMADVSIRGTLGAGFDLMINVGILFIYTVGAFVAWKMQALICGSIPILIFILMLFVPESPRYLVQKGKQEEATRALIRFRGATSAHQVEPELRVLRKSVHRSDEKSMNWRDLLVMPVLRPVSIAFIIYFFQVFSGVDPVLFYTVDIFHSAGADIDDYYSTIAVGVTQVVAAAGGALLVDRTGRRFLLMLSEAVMVLSLASLGLYFYLKKQNDGVAPEGLSWLPLLSLVIYVIAYSIGVGPVGYMIMGEILPHHVKGLAGCLLTSAKWLMSFFMTKFFQNLINTLGEDGGYWFFASFCLLGFFYVFFFVPETKGKTLDEIQREFSSSYRRKSVTEASKLRNGNNIRRYYSISDGFA